MSDEPYTVVVGVSATSKSPTALAWAAAQARQNNGRVIAVRAWKVAAPQATPAGTSVGRIEVAEDVERDARERLEQDVEAVLGPDHGVEIRLVRGGTYRVLVKAAAQADLLVVDAPRQLLVGPMFAHRLIYATACPVVVMPAVSSDSPSKLTRAAEALGRSVVTAAGTAGRPGYRPPLIQ
jgi:hypothetical protein